MPQIFDNIASFSKPISMPHRARRSRYLPAIWPSPHRRLPPLISSAVEALSRWVADQKPLPARLDPSQPAKGARKNDRWQLLINATVEGD